MTIQPENASAPIEIRKYPNRRYYDTSSSRHLTLEDIRQLIRKGADVRIVDSQTGADITSKTLTQMILEFDSPKLDLFTVPLLTELIRVNDSVMKGFFEKFFHQALSSFFAFQQQLERQMRAGGLLPSLFPTFSPWTANPQREEEHPQTPKDTAAPGPEAGMAETVATLKAQIAALEKRLERPLPRNQRRKAKRRVR
jgi:polyhydroxyalkanoate synthesis repressor PhaR